MTDANHCLSDEELTSLIQGAELGDRRHVLMLHLDRCPGCRMVLAEAARHLSSTGPTSPGSQIRAVALVSLAVLVLLALWILGPS